MGKTQSERNTQFKKLKEEAGKCGDEILKLFVKKYSDEAFALAIAVLYENMPSGVEYTKDIALAASTIQEKKLKAERKIILPNA